MVNKNLCCISGSEAMPQDATLMMACAVVTTTVSHTWDDTGKECKQSTVTTTDGVDGTPKLEDVNAAICCVAGAQSMPQDAILIMACDDVNILTSEVTYTWNNDDKQCTESTVIDTNGVDGAAVTKMVNKDLCCVSGTEAKPQDATLMMACPV